MIGWDSLWVSDPNPYTCIWQELQCRGMQMRAVCLGKADMTVCKNNGRQCLLMHGAAAAEP